MRRLRKPKPEGDRPTTEREDETEAGHRPERLTSALDALDPYTKEHFRAEEALMTSRHYERLDEHRKQHQAFEEWLQAVKVIYNFSTSPDFFADTVNTFMRHWLINHILKTDKAYPSGSGGTKCSDGCGLTV